MIFFILFYFYDFIYFILLLSQAELIFKWTRYKANCFIATIYIHTHTYAHIRLYIRCGIATNYFTSLYFLFFCPKPDIFFPQRDPFMDTAATAVAIYRSHFRTSHWLEYCQRSVWLFNFSYLFLFLWCLIFFLICYLFIFLTLVKLFLCES